MPSKKSAPRGDTLFSVANVPQRNHSRPAFKDAAKRFDGPHMKGSETIFEGARFERNAHSWVGKMMSEKAKAISWMQTYKLKI